MKKLTFLMCLMMILSAKAQNLYVGENSQAYFSSDTHITFSGDVDIDATGDLILNSDMTQSSSFIVSGSVTGNITYKRYIDDTNWYIISAPVTSQSINDFATDAGNALNVNGANYAIGVYDNTKAAGTRWTYYTTATAPTAGNFGSGNGYAMNRTSAGEFTFKGDMAVTDVNVSMVTASGTHYWHGIGNPYPSFLPVNTNASATNVLSQNIGALDASFVALYLWDGSSYQVFNQTSDALYLAPGQGFMVNAASNNEVFTFTETLQDHQIGADDFFRTNNNTSSIVVTMSNGSDLKTTTIKYFSNTTTGLDPGYDAGAYQDGVPEFSLDTHLVTESQGIDFTLQCLPDSGYENMVIPLSVRASSGQTLSFSAIIENLPAGIDAYLEDKETNSFYNISESSFQVTTTNTLNGVGRFYLHTSQNALSIDDITQSSINIYTTERRNLRITGLENVGNAKVRIYDVTGKSVFAKSLKQENILDLNLPESLRAGLYIVQVSSEQKNQTKKLIIE